MHVCVLTSEFNLFLYVMCACVHVCVLTTEFKLFLYVSEVGVQIFDGDAEDGGCSFDQVRNLKVRELLVQQVLHPLLNTDRYNMTL